MAWTDYSRRIKIIKALFSLTEGIEPLDVFPSNEYWDPVDFLVSNKIFIDITSYSRRDFDIY